MSEKIKTQGNRQETHPSFMEIAITSGSESVHIAGSHFDSMNHMIGVALKVLEIVKKQNNDNKGENEDLK